MFYFLNLLYQYTVMSDTRLLTIKILCLYVDNLRSVNCLWCLEQSTSIFTHQSWKKNQKVSNLSIFPLWLQTKGLFMLMKVCFVEELNTYEVIQSTGFAFAQFEYLYKISVENITLRLGVEAVFTSEEKKIICLKTPTC